MALYGRDWYGTRGGRPGRGRTGGGWSGRGRGGYGWASRRPPGTWRPARNYGEYDYEWRGMPPSETGGRGWPYQPGYQQARWEEYPPGYYGEEFERPERYRMRRSEYRRGARPTMGRERGTPRRVGRYPEPYGYGEDYGYAGEMGEAYDEGAYGGAYGPAYSGYEERYARGFAPYAPPGGEVSYGSTPSSRWPEDGHDVDHLSRWERTLDDDDVREAVKENLFQDTWVDPDRIEVDVEDGVVTLTGDVRDFMEARYAWDDAWESAGVRGVINNLTVRTDRPSEEMDMPQTSGGEKSRTGGTKG